jgi:predicted nucleotidyltransferase
MTQFEKLLHLLSNAGVEFIVVGGVAAAAHGAARTTLDLDVVYRRTPENLSRIVAALSGFDPYPRGAPPGLPFHWDVRTLQLGTNFTLTTSLGYVDLLGEITGGGTYDDLERFTVRLGVFGISCRCIDLSKLIEVKTAAGRPKDFEAVSELKVIQEERKRFRGDRE